MVSPDTVSDTPSTEQILHERIEDNLRHVPTAAVGGSVNALAVALTMLTGGHAGLVTLWLAAVLVCAAMRYRLYRTRSQAGYHTIVPRKDARAILAIALATGSLWGLGIAVAASVADTRQFVVIAILSGGMLGASVLTYSTMALGAVLFMAPICLGTIVAWALFPGASILVGTLFCCSYLLILGRGAYEQQGAFVRAIAAREQLREAGATVQLLLNDFETQASDWLWTVDVLGQIVAPARRFGEAAGRAWQLLDGEALADLFDPGPERERLEAHLVERSAFRDLTLPLTIGGSPHWWTLSAQPAPEGMRGVASDVTAEKRAEARISHMAHYDGLTGLANRFLFHEALKDALRPRREGAAVREVAVLTLDLDRFKVVNDTLGHPVGDRLLCEVARRIESAVRADDLIARLGGDEFAVLIKGQHLAKVAERAACRIIDAVNRECRFDGQTVLASTSVGITVAEAGSVDVPTLMKQGDLALYAAKARGRGVHAWFETGMDAAAAARRELEMDMRAALAADEFELHFQPVVSATTRETVSYEALVRWRHPRHGMIMPDSFIALAEETGLIVALGEWVIRHACAELARWPAHLSLAVNLSPAQLRSPGLITTIVQAVAHNGIDPARLELEITETVLMQDEAVHAALLHHLRGLGVRVALDDFGTGYSSLSYLRKFPFDKIKIDRCFLAGLDEAGPALTIVRAVIAIARSMGMTTTAEGVETEEQLAILAAEGCDLAQGFLFARAAPAASFPHLCLPEPALRHRA